MPTEYAVSYGERDTTFAKKYIMNNISGVEGIPYQFMSSVDRRLPANENAGAAASEVGRKYTEKILSRIPLLFLIPCEPVFMDEKLSKQDRNNLISALLTGDSGALDTLKNKSGRYYSVDFAYARYYDYLNCMLSSVVTFLGLQNEKVFLPNNSYKKLIEIPWQNETSKIFKDYWSCKESLVFYLDGVEQVSESFSNDTTVSSLASMINGFGDTANELRFLFGSDASNAASSLLNSFDDAAEAVSSSLSGVIEKLGGGIVTSLANDGVSSVINGGKIIFPEIWADSSYDRSMSIDIKLRSPDNDSLSIFLNVIKPYCKILALCMAHTVHYDPNSYRSPFLVKAYCKGLFNIDMGIISSINVTKGAKCAWNNDGLPTQIDISIEIKDLYKSLAMSGYSDDDDNGFFKGAFKLAKNEVGIVTNTAYMDFLANMCGLNINEMEITRRAKMFTMLTKSRINELPSTAATRFDQAMSRLIGNLYKRF